MTLHFAYGSNMHAGLMAQRCRTAKAIGVGRLPGWRFVVTADGYASIVPARAAMVHGVLWRLEARDLAALNAYEDIDKGLYRSETLWVIWRGRRVRSLVYIAREAPQGRPKPGYQELIVEAARDWRLPDAYVRELEGWARSSTRGARTADARDIL